AVHVPSRVAFEAAVAVVGAVPNARLQVADEAIVPVAATSSLTSATAAVPVRNVVAADAPRGRPPRATKIAAPPTTSRSAMTKSFSFMDRPPKGALRTAPDGRTLGRAGEKSLRGRIGIERRRPARARSGGRGSP